MIEHLQQYTREQDWLRYVRTFRDTVIKKYRNRFRFNSRNWIAQSTCGMIIRHHLYRLFLLYCLFLLCGDQSTFLCCFLCSSALFYVYTWWFSLEIEYSTLDFTRLIDIASIFLERNKDFLWSSWIWSEINENTRNKRGAYSEISTHKYQIVPIDSCYFGITVNGIITHSR